MSYKSNPAHSRFFSFMYQTSIMWEKCNYYFIVFCDNSIMIIIIYFFDIQKDFSQFSSSLFI